MYKRQIPHIKISLVKITNEVQNNVLINEILQYTNDENETSKLNINDILRIIENSFVPSIFKVSLMNGQLNFQNLKLMEVKKLIMGKYLQFRTKQLDEIQKLDDDIIGKLNISSSSPNVTTAMTSSAAKSSSGNNIIDPKREKLLKLYRDTVLNRLQSKNKLLDELYLNLEKEGNYHKIVHLSLIHI